MRYTAPFDASYHPGRPYLLQRGVFALLAFDLWIGMIPHGARYGMGDFNVTHFALLDPLVPVPSSAFYVGMLTLCGLMSLTAALVGMARFLKASVFVLYTAAWVMSLQGSYQHHYLLSWLLLWTLFMPDVPADSAGKSKIEPVVGWGLPMTALTCAIVYSFTAVAKSERDFRAGHVLRRLSHSKVAGHAEPGVLDPLRDWAASTFGVSESRFWSLLALSVMGLQCVVAVGYVAASMRDERPARWRSLLCAMGLAGAVSFHGMAEMLGMFDIGWFSYYMLWIAVVVLAPAVWVARLAHLLTAPARWLDAALGSGLASAPGGVLFQLVAGSLGLVALGTLADLPGAMLACVAMAVLSLGWGVMQLRASFTASVQRLSLACALTALLFFLSVAMTEVRFDYYRRAGGELLQMRRYELALSAYRKAERYAPPGKSRRDKLEALERLVAP